MDGFQYQDPFLWDVDAVAQQLCNEDCPWSRDPAALAARIQNEEVDGKTLLTYEFVCSRQELMECLGVKLARHRAALGEAIIDMRAKSRAFQQWRRRDIDRKQMDDAADFQSNQSRNQSAQYTTTLSGHDDNHQKDLRVTPSKSSNSEAAVPELARTNRSEQDESSDYKLLESLFTAKQPRSDTAGDGPSPKRKRVAPMNLSSRPMHSSIAFVPTEADSVGYLGRANNEATEQPLPWESAPSYAFLGDGSLSENAILSSSGTLSTRLLEVGEETFATPVPNKLPRGRRQVVHHSVRRLLLRNGRKEALMSQGFVSMRSPSPSLEDDPILDLFDLPDSLDEETLKEMAAEQLDNEKKRAFQAQRFLTQEQVRAILDGAIDSMSSNWQDKKLPRYERKAYKIWTDAGRHGTRKGQIFEAQRQARFYDDRIKKLCNGILDETWVKEAEVRLQARCLEQNLDDKLHQMWLVTMLGSRAEPAKPQTLPIMRRQVTRRRESVSDGELLTSSDEDDFIVPDDEGNPVSGDDIEIVEPLKIPLLSKPLSPASSKHIDPIKSGFPEMSKVKTGKPVVIDLTTPTKPKHTIASSPIAGHDGDNPGPTMPPVESFEPLEDIGEVRPRRWAKENDRWRLVLCLMYQLPHARRTAILELIQDKPFNEAWTLSVQLQLADPLSNPSLLDIRTERLMAFDLTRVFLSFVKVSAIKETHISNLKGRDESRLREAKKGKFSTFCKFLKQMADKFPQESQIYRTNVYDDELEGDDEALDEPDSQNNPSHTRRPVAKEIVRNREAVDLREREKQRVEEQQARRLKLRADLAASGVMSRDKSRLIINETKQEDQSFIYVNEEIAGSIKDHQIEGVRFLWNQLVMDLDVRQGCLLAHTMGLGKTMQVITLLVALQEAGVSPDPSVKAQIPHDMKESKTLVLCPSGLVDNWMDELLTWAPGGLLGSLRRVDAVLSAEERSAAIRDWAKEGGVLTIGYNMFKRIFDQDPDAEVILSGNANIVIADEAHLLKNPNSRVNQVCQAFRTMSRIALTGSPLANNVEEYHAMINWVAPNFLGPLGEFRDIYAKPIHTGLYTDSLPSERRKALKMLQVLKETVAPKINRATIKSIRDGKNGLPPKHEFVISVSPTDLQRRLYQLYINGIQNGVTQSGKSIGQAQIFSIVSDLGLICNHPRCFHQKVLEVQKRLHDNDNDNDNDNSTFPQIISGALKETNNSRDLGSPELSLKVKLLTIILDESRRLGDKVLVFSQSIPTIDYLANLFQMQKRRASRLDGHTAIGKRQDMVKGFNQGNHEVYLISTTAGGVGLNIQGANRVVIFDSRWNPVNDQQAIGRAYRIGQKKPVFVYRFLVAGSFEDDMQNKSVFKMQLSSRVVDKKNPVSWAKRLSSLIHHVTDVPPADLTKFVGNDQILDELISYKSNGEAILKIVSSDTFEEEDPTVTLTAEEIQDAENMVLRNRLRLTDPEEYARLIRKEAKEQLEHQRQVMSRLQQNQLAEQQQLMNQSSQAQHQPIAVEHTPATLSNSKDFNLRPVHQTMDGAADDASFVGYRLLAPAPTSSPVVPLPVAGTNTFFGQPVRPESRGIPLPVAPPSWETPSSTEQPKLFGQPLTQQAKNVFESHLAGRLGSLQGAGYPGLTDSPYISHNATLAIENVLKKKSLGFFKDGQRWRLLDELLDHERFAIAMVSGHLTATFVALATKHELESRVEILEGLSEGDFRAQLNRRTQLPDPQNLDNIQRSSLQAPQSPQAMADLKVMREAADNRRSRSQRLPSWAKKELAEEVRRGSLNGD